MNFAVILSRYFMYTRFVVFFFEPRTKFPISKKKEKREKGGIRKHSRQKKQRETAQREHPTLSRRNCSSGGGGKRKGKEKEGLHARRKSTNEVSAQPPKTKGFWIPFKE